MILAFYFVAVFDTSVAVDYTGPSYGLPERVNNVGLMQDRQIGIIVGFAAAIGGGVLMYIGRLKRTPSQVVGSPQQEQAAPMNSGPSAIGDHERLATLHQAGALTDDEFAALKSKLTR